MRLLALTRPFPAEGHRRTNDSQKSNAIWNWCDETCKPFACLLYRWPCFAGITLRVGRCTNQLAPPKARMPAARQSHEKRRRGTANRTFSPHHCILPGERRPLPTPTRPKTPKVCALTLTAQVASKQARHLPGMMQTSNVANSPARSYSAYFWAFSNRSAISTAS